MFRISKELFQYEQNRHVYIKEEYLDKIQYVQIYNIKSQSTWTQPVVDKKVLIPNDLLKSDLPITVVGCTKDKESGSYWVVARRQFNIIRRPRPGSYEEEETMSYTLGLMPFVVLRKVRTQKNRLPEDEGDIGSQFIELECRNLIPGLKYKICLETRSRYRGCHVGKWRHPVNFNHPEAKVRGLGYAQMRHSQSSNVGATLPDIPDWMPNNGLMQTEWEFIAKEATYTLRLNIDETFASLRKFNADESDWNSLIGVSQSHTTSAPLIFRFSVFQADSEHFISQYRTLDQLKIGFNGPSLDNFKSEYPGENCPFKYCTIV